VKYVDAFRDPDAARRIADRIHAVVTRPWTVMEVCGGQTHAIVRFGIDRLLPDGVELLHGPGCPVCVTPIGVIDRALAIAARPEVTFCTFGDMLRVPGTRGDLGHARAEGADLRVVYSPLDALQLARDLPTRQVVFFGVGFETTAPAVAMAIHEAARLGVDNFSALISHVLVPPAIEAIAGAADRRVDGFLAAGHVCTIMGTAEYVPLAERHGVPIVVTGFEPTDLLRGLLLCLTQLEEGRHEVENAYARVVREDGNAAARGMVESVFEIAPFVWRGIGAIPRSGLRLRAEYAHLDAARRFGVADLEGREHPACRSGDVLQGRLAPTDCPAFGTRCTPDHPLGATMVSSEGACAAWYRYRGVPCPT
jgi:hydrogenase expression/formation protein HypD